MPCSCCGPDKPAAAQDNSLQAEQVALNASSPVESSIVFNNPSREGATFAAQETTLTEAVAGRDECCEALTTKTAALGKSSCQDNCCESESDSASASCRDEDEGCCQPTSSCCDVNTEKLANEAAEICKKGCCGETTGEGDDCCPETQSQKVISVTGECKAGCCGDSIPNLANCSAQGPTEMANSCSNGGDTCCGGTIDSKPAKQDDCCSDPSATSTAPGRSVTSDAVSGKDDKVMDCCRGKPSPCCDESCLDRLALRECDTGSESSCCEKPTTCNSSGKTPLGRTRKPCDKHRRSIREEYAERLQALGCICRALLALGKESCCESARRPSVKNGRGCKRLSKESLGRSSLDSCCPSSSNSSLRRAKNQRQPVCRVASPKILTYDRSAVDSCCAPKALEVNAGKADTLTTTRNVEAHCEDSEHIVLSISGMTCTGCETKLNRTLATVSGVTNLKTSLVLSRAEFDIDLAHVTADHVVRHLERTTEFRCELINTKGSSLDVVVEEPLSSFMARTWPDGIFDISIVGKGVARVSFDPEVVGARDLLEDHWKGFTKLAPICSDPALAAGSKHVRHVGYMTLLSAVLTIPVLVIAWAPLPKREIAYGSASLALATIVQIAIAGPFYPKALKALVFSRVIEMDLLIVLSTSAAYIFSVVSFGYLVAKKPLSTGDFFETSTLLVTLIMVGRYIAALARQKAVESISIRSLQAQTALLVNPADSSSTSEIDTRLLQFGDVFKVLPDSRIPTDGTIVYGSSEVDESMLTGESLPVEKRTKSRVIAGTINGSGMLTVQLNRLPGDNTITTIAAMVDQAKLSKPKMQELADKVASYFVPVVIILTVITFVTWVAVGIKVQEKSASDALVQSITYAITVLIVSCPCAIGLAVPMVVVVASGIAAERGVIFKSADAIETAYKTSHIVLDKTGTLTKGQLTVVSEVNVMESPDLSLLLGLIGENKHPVSAAVSHHLKGKGISLSYVNEVQNVTGKGIEGKVGKRVLRAGNSRWLGVSCHETVQRLLAEGYTVFCFTIDGNLASVFALEDALRHDAERVVQELQNKDITVHIVSGDDDGPVCSVAAKLGILSCNIRSRSSPADKQAYIKSLLGKDADKNKNKPVVVFCGDGTNDAVALAQASIGVHMIEGSDVAQSAADVVLMRPELSGLLSMINASKVSVRRIKFNFGWSFVYNTLAVLLAAGAFVHARIPPEFAGLGELVSVLPVIAAAVVLRWSKI